MAVAGMWRQILDRLAFKSWYTDVFQQATRADLQAIRTATQNAAVITQDRYRREILSEARYADPLRLERFGWKLYSQYDEDGIIAEIFRRINVTNRTFVEFGVEDGTECNTLSLLLQGWRGLWLEGGSNHVAWIETHFDDAIRRDQLSIKRALVTAENINELIGNWAKGEIDLLSIDIDGNDIHVFEALSVIRPRAVVIEYDAKFPPPIAVAPLYQPERAWRKTSYMGASLEALVRIAHRRGYSLVGCGFAGVNAFFVRTDLAEDRFHAPFTAENHYHPPRYFLRDLYQAGHPRDWGPYVEIPE